MLDDVRIHVRFKLCALWCAVVLCYLYGDYFELYQPGKLQGMLSGRMALGPISQNVLLAMAALLAIPSVMVFLSLVLPATIDRWANIAFGILYTAIMILAIQGAWRFYVLLGVIEIFLTALIVWYAWTWPKKAI